MKTKIFLALVFVVPMISCSKKDADKIAEAQACLDTASADEAYDCVSKVDGLTSKAAYMIRCSADFVYQDFLTASRLVEISDQLKNSAGASNASTLALGMMSFTRSYGSLSRANLATQASTNCTAAGSPGMIFLASATVIATAIDVAGGGAVASACNGSNDAACETAVQGAVCAADETTLGNAAIASYNQNCITGPQVGSSMCTTYAAAGAATPGANAATVGEALSDILKSGGGCP